MISSNHSATVKHFLSRQNQWPLYKSRYKSNQSSELIFPGRFLEIFASLFYQWATPTNLRDFVFLLSIAVPENMSLVHKYLTLKTNLLHCVTFLLPTASLSYLHLPLKTCLLPYEHKLARQLKSLPLSQCGLQLISQTKITIYWRNVYLLSLCPLCIALWSAVTPHHINCWLIQPEVLCLTMENSMRTVPQATER